MVVESLAPLFCVVEDYYITFPFFCHISVNELNSKSYLLNGGTPIPENANLNDYNTPGNYYCYSDLIARTIENRPFTKAFTLKVEYSTGIGYPCQSVREYATGRKAYRFANTESAVWSDWIYFSDDYTVLTNISIDSLQTLSKSVVPAINEIGGNTTDGNLLNAYNRIKDELWETWDAGSINTSFTANGPSMYILGYKHTDGNYGAFIIFSYYSKRPAYAYINSGTWHAPVYI